jgi:succinate dehydrogenase/fumarate reductase flavoprotein subunit
MRLLDRGLQPLYPLTTVDIVVIGAGGAGMAAALFAALEGASVLLVERTAFVGGTTAWSAGTSWIPGSHHEAAVNPDDTLARTAHYLDNAVGERSVRANRQAFLDNGCAAVDQAEQQSALKYRPYPKHPDYISDLAGSTLNGRALEPVPFDGRLLGDLFRLLRPPIPEFTVLGGMMVDRTDINHLLAMTRNWASFKHALSILSRHARDRMAWPRGTRLVMGNAHVARLLYSLSRHEKVTLALETTLRGIKSGAAGVEEIEIESEGETRSIRINKGLVLASGGFNRHPDLRAQLLPDVPQEWSPAAPGHTGQAHDLIKKVGGIYGQDNRTHAFWAPVSMRKRADGSTAVFPHFVMDRAKPGMITVNAKGERFVNESTSYHLFAQAMLEAHRTTPTIPAFLICDTVALRRYGIGMVRPGGKGLASFLADGYLTEGRTIEELAGKLEIPSDALRTSVDKFNHYAETGIDPDFHRGETAYQQNLGDPAWAGKNPNLGPLQQAPFYAVRLYPGDIGASTGFATNQHAQVLDAQGQAIGGLYAVGNDMQSIMGDTYPAPGITIGPGTVFARIAARHALGLQ